MNTTRDLCTAAREAAQLAREEALRLGKLAEIERIAHEREDIKKIVGEEFFYQCQYDPDACMGYNWLICGEFFIMEHYDDKIPYLRAEVGCFYGNACIPIVTDLVSLGKALEKIEELRKEIKRVAVVELSWYKKIWHLLWRDNPTL
jgi:hypothetical protein